MQMKIEKKTENKLLNRTEIEGAIAFQGATPSNKDVIAELAKQLKVEEDVIAMKIIDTQYGRQQARFKANVYKDKETLLKTEPKMKVKEKKEEAAE